MSKRALLLILGLAACARARTTSPVDAAPPAEAGNVTRGTPARDLSDLSVAAPATPETFEPPADLSVAADLSSPPDTVALDGGAPSDSGLVEVPCPKLEGHSGGEHCFLNPK